MTDAMYQHAVGRSGERGQALVTSCTLRTAKLHLDELVVVQRPFGLGDDRGRHPGVADEEHGFQCMTQTPEILALTF